MTQGSNLDPLLFTPFLNELFSFFICEALAYGEDIKLYSIVRTGDDSCLLQRKIYVMVDWCDTRRLSVNTEKCSVVT